MIPFLWLIIIPILLYILSRNWTIIIYYLFIIGMFFIISWIVSMTGI